MPPRKHQPSSDKVISMLIDSYIHPSAHSTKTTSTPSPKDAPASARTPPHLPPLPPFVPFSVPPLHPRPPPRQPSIAIHHPRPLRLLPPDHYLLTTEPSPTFTAPRTAPMPPTPLYDPLASVPCNTVTLTVFHATPMLTIKTTSASATILIVSRLACISVHIAPHLPSAAATVTTDLLTEATTLFRQNAALFPKAGRHSPDCVRSYVVYALVKKRPVLDVRQRGEVYERLKELGLGVADASYMLLPPSVLKGRMSFEGLRRGESKGGKSAGGSGKGKERARARGTVVITRPGFVPRELAGEGEDPVTAIPISSPTSPMTPTSPSFSISSPLSPSISSPFSPSISSPFSPLSPSPLSPPSAPARSQSTRVSFLPSGPSTSETGKKLARVTLDSRDITEKPQKRLVWEYIDSHGDAKIEKYCLMLDGVCVVQREDPPEDVDVWVRGERKWRRWQDGQWMYWF
ncbi:hypothetical protein K491DRAFT_677002 [Lophiostoma macrostomum CBS 122681]|uniref:Uncharacterized protein n=1 Tax=Lophiostoma macrostomum CBS 122681 TaxID=1314788 RepID=A0A6A6TEG4_9PLEO|nr:hypothetical protein K491DRAFT_677002 [Lophiostoma macrostomum CBS 122681]